MEKYMSSVLPEIVDWQRVDCETYGTLNVDQRWWWKHAGLALAVLLYRAGYPSSLQYRHLKFFASSIVASLGPLRDPSSSDFGSSYMNNDGNPLKLSWDWGTCDAEPPIIRYSIDPVGADTGTPPGLQNLSEPSTLHMQLLRYVPGINIEWFDHFQSFFSSEEEITGPSISSHQPHMLYAIDLGRATPLVNAHFFPEQCARSPGQTSLAAILGAIETLPRHSTGERRALQVFIDFMSEPKNSSLEIIKLATDMIDPAASRLKVYFRSHETTFASVAYILTLGGRLDCTQPHMSHAMKLVHQLWNALFGLEDERCSLSPTQSNKAGVLYNVEWRSDDATPSIKVYIPVQHYAGSDERTLQRLCDFLRYLRRDKYVDDFLNAVRTIFSPEAMRKGRGIQTYIGCSVCSNGALHLVSYLDLQPPKLLSILKIGPGA